MAATLRFSLPGLTTSLGLLFLAGAAALLLAGPARRAAPALPLPQTAVIPPTTLLHRLDGEYSRAGRPIDAPRVTIAIDRPLEVMRYQVTVADYARCVAAGACKRLDNPPGRGDLPVTGVSHTDATDYAGWLSRETGTQWRLSKDLEWARPYVSEDRRGAAPKGASDVLKVGDIVRLSRDAEGAWALAQVPAAEAAIVAIDPNDGAVVSLVGGFSFQRSKFNRATQSARQPGSSFKPFLYSAAFDRG